MENIALSDSNDELSDDIIRDNDVFRTAPKMFTEQQVTSELQDAANTNVTKATFVPSANTPFKPLFPAPISSSQSPSTNSPLLFQQRTNNIPLMNPLLQPPTSATHLQSSLIQPSPLRPPAVSNTFQAPPSAFTPLNPLNTQPSSSIVQPKLIIGNQQTISTLQSSAFPISTTPSRETVNVPPPPISSVTQDNPAISSTLYYAPVPSQTSATPTIVQEPNITKLPPPPQQVSTTGHVNPYSARASLTERIYPAMPTSQVSIQPQQLSPPMSFQQSNQASSPPLPPPPNNIFVPSPPTTITTVSNTYSGADSNIYNPTYETSGELNATSWPNYSMPLHDQQQNDSTTAANSNRLWGWFSNNRMLATVVEKAKTGIETVITTVDPQMKQYIQSGYEINIVVTSAKDVKLTPVREAFTQVFGRVVAQGIGVQSNVAPQPIGFEAGFKGAQQRIENLRRQNVVQHDQCVVSIENFIAELLPDMFFDLGYVLLSDPSNSIELHLFTQAIPVPIEYVYQARERTPADYPLRWSGYMVTVGEILHSQLPHINPEDWHEMMSGTSRRDIIYATCKSLAYMYKQRLDRKQ